MRYKIQTYTQGDRAIWIIVFLLALISIPLVYSTSNTLALQANASINNFLFKQVFFIVLGFLIIYFTHRVNYKLYSKLGVFIFLISLPLLVYTYLFGISINEAARWISIPGTGLTIQTSEIAKTGIILYLCRYIANNQDKIKDFKKGFLPIVIPLFITVILIAPSNLSTGIFIGLSGIIILFIGRAKMKHLFLTMFVCLLPLFILISWVVAARQFDKDPAIFERKGRVNVWINRINSFIYSDEEKEHYQVQQSKMAISKGGWFGVGPGNSSQKNFLPSAFSDYIFSMAVEEYGIIGSVVILFLYLLLTYRSIRIFKKCEYAFGSLIAVSFGFNLLVSALFNTAVNAHLLPVTGITLPFISRGGTSFMISCFQVGVILSVSKSIKEEPSAASAGGKEEVKTEPLEHEK